MKSKGFVVEALAVFVYPRKVPMSAQEHDEFVAMKMLTRFKQLRREDPHKPQPDIGWMLELLHVVREYERNVPRLDVVRYQCASDY